MMILNKKIGVFIIGIILLGCLLFFFLPKEEKVVVVYVAHDQDYSEPILKKFENLTGIKVKALYDTEATKTVGLVNRLIAEKNNPQADVFWNNEMIRSILLKEKGILQPYCSPNAKDIPSFFKDEDCYWTGFAARARVIIYNIQKINESEAPSSIYDFINPKWKGKACIANPILGSTSTHIASLFALLGKEKAKEFLLKMKANEVQIVESNSMVRDQVVAGECWFGLTDTDDAWDAILAGKPIKMVFPDQDGMGTLVFPNTVMLIKNAPHAENGKKLIDFLLSNWVEEELARKALQIPLKKDVKLPENVPKVEEIRMMNVSFQKIYENLNESTQFIHNIFLT